MSSNALTVKDKINHLNFVIMTLILQNQISIHLKQYININILQDTRHLTLLQKDNIGQRLLW